MEGTVRTDTVPRVGAIEPGVHIVYPLDAEEGYRKPVLAIDALVEATRKMDVVLYNKRVLGLSPLHQKFSDISQEYFDVVVEYLKSLGVSIKSK